ncbi:hypothetical protein EI94DRAFT_1706601 [Lactarius quietus]|nr:hypothetical protein EI94DRAFT_1706601 [Lactarius quietus]
MRLFRVLPVLSLLFGARASSLDLRQLYSHPRDTRDVLDVCTFVYAPFFIVINQFGDPVIPGPIDACICISTIPEFMQTNQYAALAVAYAGEQATSSALTDLILEDAPSSDCNYPDNSSPACVDGNPCGFTCLDGYTASPPENPVSCVCAAPNVVCNGNCVAPGGCPSAVSQPLRRWVGSGSCTEMGHGWAACGVFGGGARAWECVNTAHDLESCGGCALPLTAYSPIGRDCTAIPSVAGVSCLYGECVVHRCMSGYTLSPDSASCISTQAHISRPHIAVPEDEEEYMRAIRYGLEHRPPWRN